ncbi:MAG: hypothetical protein IJ146_13870, partial [Kiritimatiellae bacterium]|nr:hypothetical protein [Kiritimatiellia bacterium]
DRARNAVLLEHHNPVAQLQRSDAHEQRGSSSGGGMNRPTLMHEEPFFYFKIHPVIPLFAARERSTNRKYKGHCRQLRGKTVNIMSYFSTKCNQKLHPEWSIRCIRRERMENASPSGRGVYRT